MLQKGKECAQDLVNTLQQDFLAWHQQQAAQQQQMGAIASMQQPIQGKNTFVISRNSCLMTKKLWFQLNFKQSLSVQFAKLRWCPSTNKFLSKKLCSSIRLK
jgi:hypothetical protein